MQQKKSLGQNFLKSKSAIAKMVKTSGAKKGDLVLEIGPGLGVLTEALLSTGTNVVSVEKDDRLIPVLQEKFKKEIATGQLTLIHDDILEAEIPNLENSGEIKSFSEAAQARSTVLSTTEPSGLGSLTNPSRALSEPSAGLANGLGKTFVETNFRNLKLKKFKLVANIPYYITGQVIRKFLEAQNQPESMTLLLQKEVAERIVAKNGKESLLSLSVKVYGEPKYIQTVKRGSFQPAPNVDSAILHIADISRKNFERDDVDIVGDFEKNFFKLIHLGFAHKRKQLLSNLSALYEKENVLKAFQKCEIDLKVRAEDVPLQKWLKLSNLLA